MNNLPASNPTPSPSQPTQPTRPTQSPFSTPSISVPKGGGAIRGIGEKFETNPVTGTPSLNVPIVLSPGRSGFTPALMLTYDSGTGNGPFGFGWQLSLPSITRKTDEGLPHYDDSDESDVFILSGTEDLVPVLIGDAQGQWDQRNFVSRTVDTISYRIQYYQPRVEGAFSRIERWTNIETGEIHWRTLTKDNVTNLYGVDNNSRVFDPYDPEPAYPTRVFTWLICESRDSRGNTIMYHYKAEDSDGIDVSQANEANRTPTSRSANRYLKSIKYGNQLPFFVHGNPAPNDWLFEVVFDYGEHSVDCPTPFDTGTWLCRNDSFSTHRSTFEVRTYRLCQRILMFHHFPAEPNVGANCLVRSAEFSYRSTRNNSEDVNKGHPIASFLSSMTLSGFVLVNGAYAKQSLPPLEFEYSEARISSEIRDVDPSNLENLPVGVSGSEYQWLDLDGEGTTGILTEQAGEWFYTRNQSPLNAVGQGELMSYEVKFGHIEMVSPKPAPSLSSNVQFVDLNGNGQLDAVQYSKTISGFYERTDDGDWKPFVPFHSLPNVDWGDPNLRFVDLDGDGFTDVLITKDEALTWYPSLENQGYGPAQDVRKPWDEECGPAVVFADGEQAIYLADMSGDGLSDLVRIRNGNVCYWPNLGFGRFGPKVTMDHSPWFDNPDQFENKRVRLVDIDGSGTTDIIYLGSNNIDIYHNEAGNGWTPASRLENIPPLHNLSSVFAVDLLGNGTACLVWSSPLPGDTQHQMRYVDLMGGTKPHLLVNIVNNMGAETRIHYAPSTYFYLQDKQAGNPWLTRLPFPVHVVDRIDFYDRISRNRFTTRFAYHHGYFDGVEREFRGFGMVEQWDTEELAVLHAPDQVPALNVNEASNAPPVLTKTWFHTGFSPLDGNLSKQFEPEYYREPGLTEAQLHSITIDDTVMPDQVRIADGTWKPYQLSTQEMREAGHSLKGSVLRQEIYSLDGTELQSNPYKVSESNLTIQLLQPMGPTNKHAVFLAHLRETVDFNYERKLIIDARGHAVADPRVNHNVVLEVDEFGNELTSVSVTYGRRRDDTSGLLSPEDRRKQKLTRITYLEKRYTNAIREDDHYLAPTQCESLSYELLKVVPSGTDPLITNLFRFDDLRDQVQSAGSGQYDLQYEDITGTGAVQDHIYRRLVEHNRALFRRNDLTGPLPLGMVESLALPYQSYRQASTPGLVQQIFVDSGKVSTAEIDGVLGINGAGHVHSEGDANWWVPSGLLFYSPKTEDTPAQELAYARAHFFLPVRFRDPFHTASTNTESIVTYDEYDLLLQETRSPLGNRITAGERHIDPAQPLVRRGQDYRVLQPVLTMDPNRNRSVVAFDALGMVVGTAIMGKPEEARGDSLAEFEPILSDPVMAAYFTNPLADPTMILKHASTRIVYYASAYYNSRDEPEPQPVAVSILSRETHDADLANHQQTAIQHHISYSDGFGRDIQQKLQAEPGPVPKRDPATGRIVIANGQPDMTGTADPRWVGTGWIVFDNKGNTVRKYEPFFTDTHRFEFDLHVGVSPVMFYDPLGRLVASLHPDHTWSKVVFDAWKHETWDTSDTVLIVDPKTDPNVQDYFRRLPDTDYLPTWYSVRQSGMLGPQQQETARKAAAHASTPSVVHFDTLGHTILTTHHNVFRLDSSSSDQPVVEFYSTRVVVDIEGNKREVIDAKNRAVIRFDYDMLGTPIHQASMEAGERWMLSDVLGKSLYHWNSRGHQLRAVYDSQRRPIEMWLQDGSRQEVMVERSEFGETKANPEARNLREKCSQAFDQGGAVTNDDFDFKGNLLCSHRQFAKEFKTVLDWSAGPELEMQAYTTRTAYDAINRVTSSTAPDSSIIHSMYNTASLLERIETNLQGSATLTTFIKNIEYNAKGQRTNIEYGNGVRTTYEYDPLMFRLIHMVTRRDATGWPGCQVQNLSYTYDSAGNISHIRDDAQQTIFFDNLCVKPCADYTYDAIYRLIEATGREHLGQVGHPTVPDAFNRFHTRLQDSRNGNAMGTYVESYDYDAVGNILAMRHRGSSAVNPGWTRRYTYQEPSQLEAGKVSNRLSATSVGSSSEVYSYDGDAGRHGNITGMAHLSLMQWDYRDQLHATSRQVVTNAGTPEMTWYVYDANGERLRHVTERQAAPGLTPTRLRERIYVGGFEMYREYGRDGATVNLERETLHITDGNQQIALVETRTQGTGTAPSQLIRYQFHNHLGSSVLELDNQSKVISYEEYTPFGSSSYQAVRSETPKRYRYTGKERDEMSGFYYYGARYYAPWIARWISCDPGGLVDEPDSIGKGTDPSLRHTEHSDDHPDKAVPTNPAGKDSQDYSCSPYVYVDNRPTIAVDPDGRDAVYIAFPDYKITTPIGKVEGLGHAGVLLIDNKTGTTKYYEYGRYVAAGKVKVRTVPNVKIGADGKPTDDSLKKTLAVISHKAGKGGRIDGAYIPSSKFKEMNDFAKDRLAQNSNPNRETYGLFTNNCATFASDTVRQDPAVVRPTIINPTPINVVSEYQEEGYRKIEYVPPAPTKPSQSTGRPTTKPTKPTQQKPQKPQKTKRQTKAPRPVR